MNHSNEFAYEHNGQRISPAQFYAIACNPKRNVTVEACAGAGKTWMLVSRIVRALLDGCLPHEILAITFTKKAAGEMRQRLHEWLAEFAHLPIDKLRDELRLRGVSEDAFKNDAAIQNHQNRHNPHRLKNHHQNNNKNNALPYSDIESLLQNLQQVLFDSGRPVQIRTFHSWFAALLRSAPIAVMHYLELPIHYDLLEDDAKARALVWKRFQSVLLQKQELYADYLALIRQYGRFQTQKALETALVRRTEFELADSVGVVDQSIQSFQNLFNLNDPLQQKWSNLKEPALALSDQAAFDRWHEWSRSLGKESGKTAPKAANAIVDAFLGDSGIARLEALRIALFVKTENRLTKNLEKFEAAQEAAEELLLLCQAQNQHEAWLYQQRLARLTRELLAQYKILKNENAWVDMNDVERAAQYMLHDPVLSGWVQERLDARIKHLLIDEFQDTNPLQWQALYAWLSGYAGASSSPPSVFIVGDPKQSIYRFRRAEPQVFKAAQQFIVHDLSGDHLSCDHTRRNAPEILDLVNCVMQKAVDSGEYADFRLHTTNASIRGKVEHLPSIKKEDETDSSFCVGANGIRPNERDVDLNGANAVRPYAEMANSENSQSKSQIDSNKSFIHADNSANLQNHSSDSNDSLKWRDSLTEPRTIAEDELRTLECRQVAHWLKSHIEQTQLPASEIMILARKRNHLATMQTELQALGIFSQQPEKFSLAEAPEVQDVMALIESLLSPLHNLALARVLKSPLFACSDDDLVLLAKEARQKQVQIEHIEQTELENELWMQGLDLDQKDADPNPNPNHVDSNNAKKRAQKQTPISWLHLLEDANSLSCLSSDSLRKAGETLTLYQEWLTKWPPHDALSSIFYHGQILQRFAQAAAQHQRESVLANLRALLSAALQVEGGRYVSAQSLLESLQKGLLPAPARADSQALRLLTVHGAKGLEASLVILLDTNPAAPKSEAMSVLIDWQGEQKTPRQFIFLVSEKNPPPSAVFALEREQKERKREELNALYVALTRARSHLVLSSTESKRSDPNSWWKRLTPHSQLIHLDDLNQKTNENSNLIANSLCATRESELFDFKIIPELKQNDVSGDFSDHFDFDDLNHEIDLHHLENLENSETLNNLNYFDDFDDFEENQNKEIKNKEDKEDKNKEDKENNEASLLGQAFHRLLELLPLKSNGLTKEDLNFIWTHSRLAKLRIEFKLTSQQLNHALEMAKSVIFGEGARFWDLKFIDYAQNEIPITWQNKILRLDRLVHERENHIWWILDYKSEYHPQNNPELIKQLHQYKKAISFILPTLNLNNDDLNHLIIKTAFLSGNGALHVVNEFAANGFD